MIHILQIGSKPQYKIVSILKEKEILLIKILLIWGGGGGGGGNGHGYFLEPHIMKSNQTVGHSSCEFY